eukprot:3843163-Prymnesium_polylepis.2
MQSKLLDRGVEPLMWPLYSNQPSLNGVEPVNRTCPGLRYPASALLVTRWQMPPSCVGCFRSRRIRASIAPITNTGASSSSLRCGLSRLGVGKQRSQRGTQRGRCKPKHPLVRTLERGECFALRLSNSRPSACADFRLSTVGLMNADCRAAAFTFGAFTM